ncbi:hypothetical protein GCM10027594_32310 [Hymenobacter agri]
MPTPEQNPTDPRPDQAPTSASTPDKTSENDATVSSTPNQDANVDAAPASAGNTPTSTQQNMGYGAGIRIDYGDASQTNGLEGGPADSGPDRTDTPDQPQTDTELTGS